MLYRMAFTSGRGVVRPAERGREAQASSGMKEKSSGVGVRKMGLAGTRKSEARELSA